MTIPLTRRTVLASGAFGATTWLLGCRTARTEPPPADAAAPGACAPTEDNIEGPFFKPGAPRRTILAKPDAPGTRLRIVGRVLSASCAPLTGARLEVWHANDRGAYDNAGF